jgi:hypothetical protein
MIALGVKDLRHLQGVPRTIGHAQLAALAAANDDVDFATRHDDTVLVQRFAPKLHGYLLLK